MADSTYLYPVALSWSQGSQKLKKLKNKVQAYFQSKSKSDGGECEIRDIDCSRGHILIHFKEKEARDRVLQKTIHSLKLPDGETIQLEVHLPDHGEPTKPAKPPQNEAEDCKADKSGKGSVTEKPTGKKEEESPSRPSPLVLIENIKDSCTSDMLSLLVENVSDRSGDTDFYLEMIPESRCAVITFTCDIDTEDFVRKFSSHQRVQQHKITAKMLEESRTIRVEGIPDQVPEEMIALYFESPKNRGGSVEKMDMLSEENAALVTFQQAGVLQTLMTRQHVLSNKAIYVYPYYPSIGHCLYGKEGPQITEPDALEIPIDPHILEFICNNEQKKVNFKKVMADAYCDVTWPSLGHPTPAIKLSLAQTLHSHPRTLAKIVPTWSKNACKEMELLMSKYKVTECDLKPPVWEVIKEKMSSSPYDGVLVKPDLAAGKAFIAGTKDDVTKLGPIFRKLVEDTTRLLSTVEQEVPLKPEAYKLMQAQGMEKSILEDSPHVKISYDGNSKTVKLFGPQNEVQIAQCEILNTMQDLRSKSVNTDPYIIQFLKAADNEELSHSLLMNNSIKALFQVEDNAVVITAYSDKDLRNAEEALKKELVCKRISVDDKVAIQSPKWKELKTFLKEMFNAGGLKVFIEEFPIKDGSEVVITGLSSSAEETYQHLFDFVELNTPVQKDIKLKSAAILQFVEEKRSQEWNRILQNVKAVKKQNFISLSGPKPHVEEAERNLRKLISDLYAEILHIDKPGAKTFFAENEEMYVSAVWNKHGCVIQLQKEADGRISNPSKLYCQVSLQKQATLAIYKGDLCQHNADAIIIASSNNLKPTGGPALALVKAAGSDLQKECERTVKKEGQLEQGECAITDAGNLQCKKVIHACGPKWDNKGDSRSVRLLRKAISQSLETTAGHGQSSVALSIGDFVTSGCPLELCAENIVKSIKSYSESQGVNSINNIHLVESDEGNLKAITKVLSEEFQVNLMQDTVKKDSKKQKKKSSQKKEETVNKENGQMVTTKEGLHIHIHQGSIENAATAVVVNSVGKDLSLRAGAVAKALSKKAGDKLQNVLKSASEGKQAEDGSIFVTEGCNLNCNTVIHAVVPQWDGGNGSSEKIYRKIVSDCLRTTEEKQCRSVTFPAMGTGVLGFPRNTVAALMFEEILEYSSKNQHQHLKEVEFMLHPSDQQTVQAFSDELQKKISTGQKKEDKAQAFFGNVQNPAQDVYEMKIGSVTYRVKTGDITKEKCDVIINSTNNTFNLKTGVSKAILEAAGANIENECARLGAQPNNGFAVTPGGNLDCKNIIHIAGQTKPQLIAKCVTNALYECERQQATSVTFPAMGTGAGSLAPAEVANAMLEAVVDFVKSKSIVTVQNVTVVIFQKQMLKDFADSMRKKEPTVPAQPKSWFSWSTITSLFSSGHSDKSKAKEQEEEEEDEPKVFELRENIEPAIVHLCGENPKSVKEASDWLQEMITKDQDDNTITDEIIQQLDNKDHEALARLQKQNGVHLTCDQLQCTIKVSGRTKDVLEVSNKIHDMIKEVRDKKAREREAELCSNMVEWGYYQGTNFVPFDKMTNMELEKAENDKLSSLNIEINGAKYTANTETKNAQDPWGNKIVLQRNPKNAESLQTPPYWDAMDNTQLKVVALSTSSPDYAEVVGLFQKTCQMKIIKIERIQNIPLYKNYRIKKDSIDLKNGSRTNEMRLFHGTEAGATKNINSLGFNRAYAGSNAARLGKGTYFAVDANYSADDTYSKPDANKYKYMYLARVLTGVYCVGNDSMIVPPPKSPSNPTDLYDSVTDSTSAPTVFVIFNDIQAYPDYLITFTL